MSATKMSVKQLSHVSGIHEVVLHELIEGKWPITDEVAYGLSKAFRNSASYWVELQKKYDASDFFLPWKSRISVRTITV